MNNLERFNEGKNPEQQADQILIPHPLIQAVAARLESPLDWHSLFQDFTDTGLFRYLARNYEEKDGKQANIKGFFLEYCVGKQIEEIAKENPGRIKFDFIPDGNISENYEFRRSNLNRTLVVDQTTDQTDYTDYDDLFLIKEDHGSIIVLAEAKAVGRSRKEKLTEMVRERHITKILQPLKAFAQSPIAPDVIGYGFLVVTTKIEGLEASEMMNRFQRQGGVLAQILLTSEEFKERTEKEFRIARKK